MNTHTFSQTGQMIELCCEYLSVRCIWLYIIIMSHTSFRVNTHSIVCLNFKELLAWSSCHIWSLSDSDKIQTHNHLVCIWTLNHLAKLAKWSSCVVVTYLFGASECVLFKFILILKYLNIHVYHVETSMKLDKTLFPWWLYVT